MKKYTDIDYDSFPVADLDLDIHWIQLPKAVTLAKRKAHEAALQAERLAAQPDDHQVILVPADADYAPNETELWPIINHAVQSALKPHEAAHFDVMRAVHQVLDEYRGWRNPFPVSLDYPDRPVKASRRSPHN
jgi:hypothetical protein